MMPINTVFLLATVLATLLCTGLVKGQILSTLFGSGKLEEQIPSDLYGAWVSQSSYFEPYYGRIINITDTKVLLDAPLGKIYTTGPTITGHWKYSLWQYGRYQFTVIPLGRNIVKKVFFDYSGKIKRTEVYIRDGMIEVWDYGMPHCKFDPTQLPWSTLDPFSWVANATHVTCPVQFKGLGGGQEYIFRIHGKKDHLIIVRGGPKNEWLYDLIITVSGAPRYGWLYECCNNSTNI